MVHIHVMRLLAKLMLTRILLFLLKYLYPTFILNEDPKQCTTLFFLPSFYPLNNGDRRPGGDQDEKDG